MSSVSRFQKQLLAYYFGTLTADERIAVEETLMSSPAYLTEFFAIKRSFEDLPEQQVMPSLKLKTKLRADIARSFYRETIFKRIRYFLIQQKSWAFAATTAALVVGVLITHLTENKMQKSPPPVSSDQPQSWSIDSAEKVAVSLNYL